MASRFTGDAGDPLEPDHRGANNRVGPTEVNPERVCVCGGVRRLQESDLRDIARVPAMFLFAFGGGLRGRRVHMYIHRFRFKSNVAKLIK